MKLKLLPGLFVVVLSTFTVGHAQDSASVYVSGPEDTKIKGAFPDFSVLPRPQQANPTTLPRANGHPDFTGMWTTGLHGFVTLTDREVKVPLTPAYQAKRVQYEKDTAAGHPPVTPSQKCEAFGMPWIMSMNPIEFILAANGTQLNISTEELRDVRRVYLDGRAHPKEFDPNFDGHSVGHWEGDTLVIDTIGTQGNVVGFDGIYLSPQAHFVERITMPNKNGLIDEITMTDPLALTKTWRNYEYYKRLPAGAELNEFVCTNNRN